MLEGSDNSQLGSVECRKQATMVSLGSIVRRRVMVAHWARLDEAQDLEFSLWCIYNPSIISKPQCSHHNNVSTTGPLLTPKQVVMIVPLIP